MWTPSLSFLRSVVSPSIKQVQTERIKRSSVPAAVYRLRLEGHRAFGIQSLIAKRVESDWPDDPRGHEREALFYGRLLPKLDIPHARIYYAGLEPESPVHLIIMEDVARSHRFPSPSHRWTQTEVEQILETYARLHAGGLTCLQEEIDLDWMMNRHEARLLAKATELAHMVEAIVDQKIWPRMPGFERLLERTLRVASQLSGHLLTVLHNDVYPPNCGIPANRSGDVILVDWDMVGRGLAEMDLAFMFLQPFGSHLQLDRTAALDYYWRKRQQIDGIHLEKSELEARQWYADSLWALWLIPVAYRMAMAPFPTGSPPRIYWDSMFGVLGQQLYKLSDAA